MSGPGRSYDRDEWRLEREALAGEAGIDSPEGLPGADLDAALARAAEQLRDSLRAQLAADPRAGWPPPPGVWIPGEGWRA
jgi:hypothetical protein